MAISAREPGLLDNDVIISSLVSNLRPIDSKTLDVASSSSVTIVTEALERPIPTQPSMLIPSSPTAEATVASSPGLSVKDTLNSSMMFPCQRCI